MTKLVKIEKVLHLVPVTEKEEKAIQILQRKNMTVAVKVNDELNVMENKTDEGNSALDINIDTFTSRPLLALPVINNLLFDISITLIFLISFVILVVRTNVPSKL